MREMEHAPVEIGQPGASIASGEIDGAEQVDELTSNGERGRSTGARMQVRILGSLEVVRAEQAIALGGPRQRAVLAHLIVRANELVPTDVLESEIWGDEAPESARSTIHTYVSRLRKMLGADRIESQTPGYRLRLDPSELDAARFDKLVNDARKASGVIDPGITATVLDEALGLWRGDALADVAGDGALRAEAARLDELRLVAGEERIDALLAIGDHARVVGETEVLVDRHPLRERVWRQLMLSLYREGRQAEALTAYQRVREILADELGIDPSPELSRLHEQILRQDPALELRGEPLRGYRLLEKIGEGPTGVAFRAIQPRVGRDVAVKIFHEQIASDPAFVRRFEREAQAAAALEHPHIVPIYDYWREPGRAYIVSRYLKGGSLAALETRGDRLPQDRASTVVEQIASALGSAHRRAVAHGKVSASNVFLDGEANAYLGDFQVGVGPSPDPAADIRGLARLAKSLFDQRMPRRLGELVEHTQLTAEPPVAEAFAEAVRSTLEPETIRPPLPEEVRNPYKGLRPFTEADAHDFFGRSELTARLIARLDETGRGSRFLAVVGPSGGGKSSVVRAGVVPAIRQGALGDPDEVFVAEMFPGAHPIEELEQALVRTGTHSASRLHDVLERGSRGLLEALDLVLPAPAELVLVVDQFEEAFTLTADEHERELFLESLRVAAIDPESRCRVVVTLRADFYDRPLTYPRFGELLAAGTEAVPPLTPDEIEQAIRRPAEGVGITAEPGLEAEVIADVAHQPGALPLLQYALTELFERRDDERLTLAAYQEIGGIGGALSARADRIFSTTSPDGQRAIRQVFLRLVTIGEGRQDTRRRVTRSELDSLDVDPELVETVLDTYGRHRLLTFDREPSTREPTVEIAHEALLTAWARLRTWIDDAREDLRQDRRLSRAAGEWRGSHRDPSFVLRGARLEQVETWAATTDLAIGRPEREYVKASVDARDQEQAQERARREREERTERRSRSRLKALVGVLTVAALVAGTLTVIAMNQSERAERETTIATARELAATAALGVDADPERSILLAMEAVDLTRSLDGSVLPEAEDALHRAVGSSRVAMTVPGVGSSVAWGPNGVFAAEGPQGSGLVEIRDDRTGARVRSVGEHDGDVTGVAFSPDGTALATSGTDGILKVWDPSTGELLIERAGEGAAVGLSSSAVGSFAASWPREQVVRVVDRSLDRVRTVRVPGVPTATALSPDGERIAVTTALERDYFVMIDVVTGKQLFARRGSGPLAWSPNGRSIASTSTDPSVDVFDIASRKYVFGVGGHNGWLTSVAWSPDSSSFVSGALDGEVKVWDVNKEEDDADEVLSLSSAETLDGIGGVTFSPDGTQVMVGADDGTAVKVWDIGFEGDAEWANLPASGWLGAVDFLPDGHLAASNPENTATIWNIETRRPRRTIGSPRDKTSGWDDPNFAYDGELSVSPDGRAIAAGEYSGSVEVWDTATRAELFTFDGRSRVVDIDWSPNGELLVMSMQDGSAVIVDRSGAEVEVLEDEEFRIRIARFSPDGASVATSGAAPSGEGVWLWDWKRARVVSELPISTGRFAFDPSGARIATAPPGGGQPEVWDVTTGERVAVLASSSGEVQDVAFSPDGSRVATASLDATSVRMFDAESGAHLYDLLGHGLGAWRLDFSPDGTMLAAITAGEIKVWALDIDDLLEIARQNVTRPLTDEECRQFLHVDRCSPT